MTPLRRLLQSLVMISALAVSGTGGTALAQGQPEPLPARIQADGHGVDLAAGTLHLSTTDVVIGQPGAGGLAYGRIYSATGWRGSTLGTIQVASGTTNKYVVSLGAESESFTLTGALGSGTFASDDLIGSSISYNSTTLEFTYTTADGTVYVFSKPLAGRVEPLAADQGIITRITSPNGAVTDFYYATASYGGVTASRLTSVVNSYGYQLHFDYVRVTAPTNLSHFPDWRKLKKVTGINRAIDFCSNTTHNCPAFTVAWPSASYTGPEAQVATVTDALGRVTTYSYDGNGRLAAIKFPGSAANNVAYTYNGTTGRVATVNRGFGTWTYAFSDASGVRTATIADPSGNQSVAQSSIASGLVSSFRDPLLRTTSYLHDANGRVTKVTAPEGNFVELTYDGRGNVTTTRQVDKGGKDTGSVVGIADLVTTAVFPACSGSNAKTCNKPSSVTDIRGKITDYAYDVGHGGALSVTLPPPASGAVRPQTRFAYVQKRARYKNAATTFVNGPLLWVLSEVSGCATLASCDAGADETISTTFWPSTTSPQNLLPLSSTAAAGNGAVSSTTAYAFDHFGNLTDVDGALAGTTDSVKYRYDAARQLLGVIGPDPDGAGALKHRAARFSYDSYGQQTLSETGTVNSQSDADWALFAVLAKTETRYDTHGRPVEQRLFDGNSTTRLAVAQFSYDAVGRPDCSALRMNTATFLSLPAPCSLGTSGAAGADRISRTIYDAAGQAIQQFAAYGTPIQQTSSSTSYTLNGLVATLKDAKNNTTRYVYDGHDRLQDTFFPNPSTPGFASTTDYERLTYGTTTATLGFVTAQRLRDAASFAFAYDDLGRLKTRDAPGAQPDVTFGYDNFGRTVSAAQTGHTLSYAYDQLSRLLSETQPMGTVSSQYDAAGRRTRLTYPGGYYLDYDYDLSGAVTAIRENGATSGIGVLASFAYDDRGRRASLTRGNGLATTYAFDNADRLTSLAQNPAGTADDLTETFSFNPASQIATRTWSNAAYEWNPAAAFLDAYGRNGLNQVTSIPGATLAHDARGNLTFDGVKSFAYDADNRLITATQSGQATVNQTYDPAGRLYQSAGTATTRFLYDGVNVIGEYDGSNALLRRYAHGPGADEPLVWLEGSGTADRRFLMADVRGSVIAVTNASGTVTSKNTYDAYGAPAAGNVGRFQYTGQMWMAELKLYHFKARAYHPALGRFLQTDPIGYGDGLNLYQYAGSDPVNARDPSGLIDTVVVHGVRTGCSPGASCISGSADIRDFLNAFNQTLGEMFNASFGEGGTLSEALQEIRNNVESTWERFCGDKKIPFAPAGVSLQRNLEQAQSHSKDPLPAKLYWFYNMTRNGGPWDYKQIDLEYWQDNGLSSPFESFGNFNFGATAVAMGIDADFALRAAGWAQIIAGTSDPSFGYPGFPFPLSTISPSGTYGDDPTDYFDALEGSLYAQDCFW